MAESDPTLKEPRRSEGRASCSNCARILIFSGEPPRFCGYCGAALEPDSVTDSATADPDRTGTFLSSNATIDHVPGSGPDEGAAFPDRVAGFRLGRRLGSGGMGTVFEAFDDQQGRNVAVKLIAPRNLASEQALDRFRLEGRTAAAVTHPRCVFVHAIDEELGRPYIVMELMPGDTLATLVDRRGPMPPAEAVPMILDVMEGLAEFHRLGMIHRDVKPSNCFLDEEGRVKIGDFGLSKPLEGGADLTRSGAFLGTPLYASPEQIKREELDERTDVYSVAGTLYFLLTGRPPVRARDAAEALARVVSEPPPPLRARAPEVPKALEAVILKGLERDRFRRWRDLREFHEALLPFVPARVDIGSIGLRVGAYLIDLSLFFAALWAAFAVSYFLHGRRALETLAYHERHGRAIELIGLAVWAGYFIVLEGTLSASAGKWLSGLKVSRTVAVEPPGVARALGRTLVFVVLAGLGTVTWHGLHPPRMRAADPLAQTALLAALDLAGLLLLAAPMRRRSGYRGLHELASGTRVVRANASRGVRRLHARRRAHVGRRRSRDADPRPAVEAESSRVGPYRIDEPIADGEDGRRVVAGCDESLGRRAWLVLRDSGSEPPDARRCALNRLTRSRWIGGGDASDSRWDAFIAPAGRPLREVAGPGGLPWRDALPILIQLSEELEAARGDGTLPRSPAVDDVWVQDDGRVQLIDALDWGRPAPRDESSAAGDDETRALGLLRDVARLALEGDRTRRRVALPGRRRADRGDGRIRAAVPVRAAAMLDRLTGHGAPYARLAHLRSDLIAAASRPTEVGAGRRGLQLAIQTFFMAPALLALIGLTHPDLAANLVPRETAILIGIPIAWTVWAFLARGGLSYPLAGLAIVGPGRRIAGRLACGLRALLAWAVPVGLLLASEWIRRYSPDAVAVPWSLWLAGALAFVASAAIALFLPDRGPHDVLCGTTVVPV